MDDKKYRELQLTMLSIMKDIHNVCVKNNLRYYLIGGSAIGAMRHRGFIPWDPDIDIAMPRDDYEHFINVCSKELLDCHECVSYKNRKKFFPPHALVVLKNSVIYDRSGLRQTNIRPAEIFVDILPLDICPETEKEREKQARDLLRVKRVKYLKASWIFPHDNLFRRIVKICIRLLMTPWSWFYLNKCQQDIMQKYNKKSGSGMWCSMASHYSYKKLSMPSKYFGTPVLTDFEDTKLFVPEKVHYYLTELFGDYNILPSKEEQEELRGRFIDVKW